MERKMEIREIFNTPLEEVEKAFPPELERFVLPNEEMANALSKFAQAIIETVNLRKTRIRPVVIRLAWESTDPDAKSLLHTNFTDEELFVIGLVMSGIIEFYLSSMDQVVQQANLQLMAANHTIEELKKPKGKIITLH